MTKITWTTIGPTSSRCLIIMNAELACQFRKERGLFLITFSPPFYIMILLKKLLNLCRALGTVQHEHIISWISTKLTFFQTLLIKIFQSTDNNFNENISKKTIPTKQVHTNMKAKLYLIELYN